ncbi:MAG: SpoIID/LytB domain-containing protein [Clostridia bacterium]|nr:SpoIID/LytB domain-containing protein [Clostridia bacterium]
MKRFLFAALTVTLAFYWLSGCMKKSEAPENGKKPHLSDKLTLNDEGIPEITVYNIKEELSTRMDVESYVEGVLAGEIKNDWPEEAMKAQAILARTYVMRFLETRESKYPGADISTDITEAQAYSTSLINDRIKKAVSDTRGMVVTYDGELANTWFHAHSGGVTELPQEGLEYKENPPYTQSVKSPDSERAPKNVREWSVSFSNTQMKKALGEMGISIEKVDTIQIGETGASGRAVNFTINGKTASAPSLRIALGSDKLKSTLITSVNVTDNGVEFEGRGYGHGVGLSQWGAYQMAENGESAEQIIGYYFKDVDIVKMWD